MRQSKSICMEEWHAINARYKPDVVNNYRDTKGRVRDWAYYSNGRVIFEVREYMPLEGDYEWILLCEESNMIKILDLVKEDLKDLAARLAERNSRYAE